MKVSNRACCRSKSSPAGLVASRFSVRCNLPLTVTRDAVGEGDGRDVAREGDRQRRRGRPPGAGDQAQGEAGRKRVALRKIAVLDTVDEWYAPSRSHDYSPVSDVC